VLHVRSNNASAIALYHKLGFTLAHTTHLAIVKRA
jgi:ribosomal protein S18 acetylase RimI-like enzyme